MQIEKMKYSREEIDEAGQILAHSDDSDKILWAETVLNDWRKIHDWTLRIATNELRRLAILVDKTAIVPYRIKRLPSIKTKLINRNGKITLSEMQDIGGCRAIVDTVANVKKLVELCKMGIAEHKIIDENDYISVPKLHSGYRSHHLILTYHNDNPRFAQFNGVKTEMQIRSRLQHSWATAVETVDVFARTAIKIGHGPKGWRRFFKLMSSYFAFKEGTAWVAGAPNDIEVLKKKIEEHCHHHATESFLEKCKMSIDDFKPTSNAYYWLVKFDKHRLTTWSQTFQRHENELAFGKYAEWERDNISKNPIVLVAAESLKEVKEAYPNYYIDIQPFLKELENITGWEPLQDWVKITPTSK